MKTICLYVLTALFALATNLNAEQPVKGPCSCKECKCTPESHCGCYSKEGCKCTPGHACMGEKGGCANGKCAPK
jgi:hypothetical protein